MESLQPFINLLVMLTALSIVAERATNLLKHRNENLSQKKDKYKDERKREKALTARSILVGIIVAVLMKANFFEILANLDSPWETLGWIQVRDWTRSPATSDIVPFLYTMSGCVITGLALSFGSKFWHDVIGAVYEMRSIARARVKPKGT